MTLTLGDEICTYLEGVSSLGLNFDGAGTINLFSTLLPDTPDQAVAVIERGGLPPVMVLTGWPPVGESKLDQPVFQVRIRSGMTGYLAGNTLAQGVYSALQGICETTINAGGALFHLITAQQSPVYLGRDARERHEWSQNFFVMWENDQR